MKSKQSDKYEVTELQPSILLLKIKNGTEVDITAAYEMRALLIEVSSTPKYCVLLDATTSFNISTEARAMIADKEFGANRLAAAFVITSLANRLVGNFFIKFHKPNTPTKLFTNYADALKWLQKQLADKEKK